MINRLLPSENAANKISYFHITLFLISLPFDRFYSLIVLISLIVHTFLHARRTLLKQNSLKVFILLTVIYWITLICTSYSFDKQTAFHLWEKQLAILLFPLIFYFNPIDISLYKNHFLTFFSIACTGTIILLFLAAFKTIDYNSLPMSAIFSRAFINHNFSAPISMHATYLSMYVMLSISHFIKELFADHKKHKKILIIAALLILFAGLLQLSSKAVLAASFIIINIAFPFFFLTQNRRKIFLLTSLLISLLTLFLIVKIESFHGRFLVDLKEDLVQSSDKNEALEPRIVRWKYIFELIRNSPVIGYGTGAELKLLNEQYFKNKLYNSYLNNLNAHNQYLSLWLRAGIAGLLIYLYILFYSLQLSIKRKDIEFLSFLILIITVSLSENILDVNKGIFFYAFFLPFFMLTNLKLYNAHAKRAISE